MKNNIRVTKCYLIQILDENENEVDYEYVFDLNNKKQAIEYAKQNMQGVLEENDDEIIGGE